MRTMSNAMTVRGSVGDLASTSGRDLVDLMGGVVAIILADTSASMGARDAPDGMQRYEYLLQELGRVQREMPGKVLVLAFSSLVEPALGGVPRYLGRGTDLAGALRYALVGDNGERRFVVISDGEPDSQDEALTTAARISGPISCIYVGPEGGRGMQFLQQLATASGGTMTEAPLLAQLSDQVLLLLGQSHG